MALGTVGQGTTLNLVVVLLLLREADLTVSVCKVMPMA